MWQCPINLSIYFSIESEEAVQNVQNELIQFEEEATPKKIPRADYDLLTNQDNVPIPSAPSFEETNSSLPTPEETSSQTENLIATNVAGPSNQNASRPTKGSKSKKSWKSVKFSVSQLEGHSDLVMAVDCDKDYIISSRFCIIIIHEFNIDDVVIQFS